MYTVLLDLCSRYRVWIVTSSTAHHARRQLKSLFNEVESVYCCGGAELWKAGKLVNFKEWLPENTKSVLSSLTQLVPDFTMDNIDIRTAAISLSITGNTANAATKSSFQRWDAVHKKREYLAGQLEKEFPGIQAQPSGQTSILITAPGFGKHIILNDADDVVYFWGDEINNSGVDASLAEAVVRAGGRAFSVIEPKDTYAQINSLRL
jgi:hypothetical protein